MAWYKNEHSTQEIGGFISSMTYSGDIAANTVECYPITFTDTGTVSFYSSGSLDMVGYISSSNSFDDSIGAPSNPITGDDDSGSGQNFSVSDMTVSMAPVTYYFWWRRYGGAAAPSGDWSVTIGISSGGGGGGESWTDNYENLGYIDEDYSARIPVGGTEYQVYRARFRESGEVTFVSASNTVDAAGYITSDYPAYDPATGIISNYIDGGTRNGGFSLSFNAVSGTYYYFWIRAVDPSESGYVRFTIEPSTSPPTEEWDVEPWNTSVTVNSGSSINFYRGMPPAYTLSRVPIFFGTGGSYTISATMVQVLYAYLTTDTSYDPSLGEPDGNIVGSDASSSTGFSFDVTVSNGTQYYLWVRTDDGSSGDHSFTVDFAEGGGGGGTWSLRIGGFGNITSNLQESISFDAGYIYRYTVQFSASGTATFYSTGNYNTVGYLSASYSSFDDSTGVPDSYVAWDDHSGSGDNFSFTYNVTAGTTYYFWFRMSSTSSSGTVYINIDPPGWRLDEFAYGKVRNRINENVTLLTYQLAMRNMTFATSGYVTVYTVGDYDTYGYLSSSDQWNSGTGLPVNPTHFADSGGAGNNFMFTFYVVPETDYYIWFRTSDGSAANDFYFVVVPPGADTWDERVFSAGSVSTSYVYSETLLPYTMWRFSFTPHAPGSFALYTTGSLNTHGYLGTTSGFDGTNGAPTSSITDDNAGGGGNCSITYTLTAGTTYYFWVRPNTDNDSGTTTVHIDASVTPSTVGFWVYTNAGWKKATPYVYTRSGWVRATPNIYINGWNAGT